MGHKTRQFNQKYKLKNNEIAIPKAKTRLRQKAFPPFLASRYWQATKGQVFMFFLQKSVTSVTFPLFIGG